MNLLKLTLPIKAFSVNSMFYRDRSAKTVPARNWETLVIEYLRDENTQKDITEFSTSFDSNKHYLSIDLTFVYPRNMILTKTNKLSNRAFDISNVEKPLIDVIFLKKYGTPSIRNLEIDDRYLAEMRSKKIPGEKHRIDIIIKKHDISELDTF